MTQSINVGTSQQAFVTDAGDKPLLPWSGLAQLHIAQGLGAHWFRAQVFQRAPPDMHCPDSSPLWRAYRVTVNRPLQRH
ncbi:MAG: hypothetical protein WCP12_13555 [bacterium]